MKQFLLIILALTGLTAAKAQYDNDNYDEPGGFKKENVFLGGSLSLGFGSGSFAVGGNPEIGYSFNRWLDAGVVLNLNYASQTYYNYAGTSDDVKASSFNYGGGAFTRIYPLPFLFAQLQPEINWINYKYKNVGIPNATYSSLSFIAGVGYGQRIVTQGSYFLMIGLDLVSDKNSPYVDGYGHAVPIIRGGFDIYLKPSRRSTPSGPIL